MARAHSFVLRPLSGEPACGPRKAPKAPTAHAASCTRAWAFSATAVAARAHAHRPACVAARLQAHAPPCYPEPLYARLFCQHATPLIHWSPRSPLRSLPQLSCGGERQQKVLTAARQQGGAGQEGGRTGGGAMLLSIAGSSHNTFAGGRCDSEKLGSAAMSVGTQLQLLPRLSRHRPAVDLMLTQL